jgi:hypothetical protein
VAITKKHRPPPSRHFDGCLLCSSDNVRLSFGRTGRRRSRLKSFGAMHPIDAHVHVFKADPAFQAILEHLNLKLLNILVMDDTLPYRKELRPQIEDARTLVRSSRGHLALCTTFDPYKFDSPSFDAEVIKQIDQNFAEGAVAVKIWKNMGMEIKDRNGKFIMADDPNFDPIYKDVAARGKTLLSQQAEPDVAWGPPILQTQPFPLAPSSVPCLFHPVQN